MKIVRPFLTLAFLDTISATAASRAAAQVSYAVTEEISVADSSFGAPLSLERSSAVAVATVVATPELHGETILISGTIADVCTRKGCWLVVSDGSRQMRVTFKDYAFFVPKDSHGRPVLLEGVVSEQEISEEDAKHYAGEATSGPKPEEITGPQTVVTMEATGVVIL